MLFNIKTNDTSVNTRADWDAGNRRSEIQYGSKSLGLQEAIELAPLSDRFSLHSLIRSSINDFSRSNNNNAPLYFDKDIATNALQANFLFSYIFKIFLAKPLDRINN